MATSQNIDRRISGWLLHLQLSDIQMQRLKIDNCEPASTGLLYKLNLVVGAQFYSPSNLLEIAESLGNIDLLRNNQLQCHAKIDICDPASTGLLYTLILVVGAQFCSPSNLLEIDETLANINL